MSGVEVIGFVAAAEELPGLVLKAAKQVKNLIDVLIDLIKDVPNRIQSQTGRLENFVSLGKQIQNTKALQTRDITEILRRCETHLQLLQRLLQKISFNRSDSRKTKTWKAIFSLKEEEKIANLFNLLDGEYTILNTHISLTLVGMNGKEETATQRKNSWDPSFFQLA